MPKILDKLEKIYIYTLEEFNPILEVLVKNEYILLKEDLIELCVF